MLLPLGLRLATARMSSTTARSTGSGRKARTDLRVVIARSAAPILLPRESYEKVGLYGNVVFSCGHVPLDDEGKRIRLYYGAADTCIAAADFDVSDILSGLTPVPKPDRLLVD